jgi:hypothetical protein
MMVALCYWRDTLTGYSNIAANYQEVMRFFYTSFLPMGIVMDEYPKGVHANGYVSFMNDFQNWSRFSKRGTTSTLATNDELIVSASDLNNFKLSSSVLNLCYTNGDPSQDLTAICGLFAIWACVGTRNGSPLRNSCGCGKTWEFILGNSPEFRTILLKCAKFKPKYTLVDGQYGSGRGCREIDFQFARFPSTSKALAYLVNNTNLAPETANGDFVC